MTETSDPFSVVSGQPVYAKPRTRPELQLVPGSDTGTDGKVKLKDARNGKMFSFSASEYHLCQLADGTRDLPSILAQHNQDLAGQIGASDVLALFRRLRILDLLAAEPVAPPKRSTSRISLATEPETAHVFPAGSFGRAIDPAKTTEMAETLDAPETAAADQDASLSAELVIEAEEFDLAAPNKPDRTARRARASKVPPARPQPPQLRLVEPMRIAAGDAEKGANAAPGSAPEPIGAPATAEIDPFDEIVSVLADQPAESGLGAGAVADLDDEFGDLMLQGQPSNGDGAGAGGGFGAGLGGGMGGGRGGRLAAMMGGKAGMGGGAMGGGTGGGGAFGGGGFGGGMGGGGMGAGAGGGANAERLKAILASRRGGAAGGAGAAPAGGHSGETRPMGVKLFNPTWLLNLLHVALYPVLFVGWLTLPVVLLAGMTIYEHWDWFLSDFFLVNASLSAVGKVVASLFTVNLAARLAQGIVIVHHKGRVKSMGITLDFGFLPRFFLDISAIPTMQRSAQLWAYGAPIVTRLWLFGGGVLLWAATRNSGTWFAFYAIMVAQFGGAMAVRSGLPVLPGDGQKLLATYFDDQRLLAKSMLALRHVVTGHRLPPSINRKDLVPMAAYAAGAILASGGAFLFLSIYVAIILGSTYGGVGMAMFLGLAALCAFYYITMATAVKKHMEEQGIGKGAELARMLLAGTADGGFEEAAADAHAPSAWPRVIWSCIGLGLIAVAFLPYDYNAGGVVQVLPMARAQAVARTDGEIISVAVVEGDLVSPGQVLAQLSSWDQENQVKVTQAQLAEAQAQLDKLNAGAKPEQIDVAQKTVDSARSSLDLSKATLDRNTDLLKSGTVSQATFDQSNSAYQQDLASLAVAEANLALVKSAATPQDLAAAQANVDQLTQELSYRRDELDRTAIHAPMAGRVVTPNLDLLRGTYLKTGAVLLEIEKVDVIKAAINVPESDVGLIHPGAAVRLKAWSNSDNEVLGKVESVGSAASDQGSGSVIQVLASFDNKDGLLRSNMTGYAKIESVRMTVWQAYLRSIVHFFQIDVWSWIP